MILYVNGCSCTWGQELKEETREESIWANVFAKEIGIFDKVILNPEPASSNEKIYRKTIEFVADYLVNNSAKDLFVLIGWSAIDRREFYNTNKNRWQSFLPNEPRLFTIEDKNLWSSYYPDFCDDQKDFERFLIQVITLQNFLEKHNVKYYFVSCVDGFQRFIGNKIHSELTRLVDTENYFGFNEGVFFGKWARDNAYKYGPNNHPLEEAHIAWGKLVAKSWLNRNEI